MANEAAGAQRAGSKYQLAASGAVLSALSIALVFYTACEEPYLAFRWCDFALNIGVGAILLVSFAIWGLACVRNFQRASRRSSLAKLLVSACVLWSGINLFYLGDSIYGYRQDMNNPHLHPLR